jgi:hypothetical protein
MVENRNVPMTFVESVIYIIEENLSNDSCTDARL